VQAFENYNTNLKHI